MRSGRGNFDASRPEAHPFLLATAMFLSEGHHKTPVETLRTQAAEVLARLMSKERSAPNMEMITAFSRCMNADQVIARLKVMIGDCAELNLQTSSQRSDRKGEPRTISTFPPVSDDDFHAAHDAAHAVLGERPRDKTRYRRPDASGNYVDASGDLRDADGNFQWSHDGQTLPAGEMDAQLARNPNTSRETSEALLDVQLEILGRMKVRRKADFEPEEYEKVVNSDLQKIKAALRQYEAGSIPSIVMQARNMRNHLKTVVARVRKEVKKDVMEFHQILKEEQAKEDAEKAKAAAQAKEDAEKANAAAAEEEEEEEEEEAGRVQTATAAAKRDRLLNKEEERLLKEKALVEGKLEAIQAEKAEKGERVKKAKRKLAKARTARGESMRKQEEEVVAEYTYDAELDVPTSESGVSGSVDAVDVEGAAAQGAQTQADRDEEEARLCAAILGLAP